MIQRSILLFPNFENIELIDYIRNLYDPLSTLIKPHITIVFPFISSISNTELENALEKCIHSISPFELVLCGIDSEVSIFGNYMFLNVLKGKKEITFLHDYFYNNIFKDFRVDLTYTPHLTLGKFDTIQDLNNATTITQSIHTKFITTIDSVFVEMIGENEESIIIMEKKFSK